MTIVLAPLKCPSCGKTLQAPEESAIQPATCFEDCLRRCEGCGIGFSNAQKDPVLIYANPADNVPPQVRAGLSEILDHALNIRNRENKKRKFGFLTSEDAVTWTIFSYLQLTGNFAKVSISLGLLTSEDIRSEPSMLLWGVPVPLENSAGEDCRNRLISISDNLRENPLSRSEPDIVLDFGPAGVVFIEAKYKSKNEIIQADSARFNRYLADTAAFTDPDAIRRSGCYELARNWRIGTELAGARPFTLVNLANSEFFRNSRSRQALDTFASGLGPRGSFREVSWSELIRNIEGTIAPWFDQFVCHRNLC